jgi:hypothetical protein
MSSFLTGLLNKQTMKSRLYNARWRWTRRFKAWGYPWLVTGKAHRAAVGKAIRDMQRQTDSMISQERETLDRLMNKMYRVRMEGGEGPHMLRVGACVDIDRFLIYQATDDKHMWDYFAERLAHDIGRELKTMNFVTVREQIHRNQYEHPPWARRP